MTTVALRGTIGTDGTLTLDAPIPVGLPAGPAEVVVIVQPVDTTAGDPDHVPARSTASARSGLFKRTPESEALDVDAVRREINEAWQAKLLEGM